MSFLLARLGPVTGPGEREVIARKKQESQAVSPELLAVPEGAIVLLRGAAPPWATGTRVLLAPWPGIPDVATIWSARAGRRRERLGPALSSRGNWVIDHRGVACEVGHGRADGHPVVVLNYAGWRLGDFPDEPVDVVECRTEGGLVWIVTPEAVPAPAPEPVPSLATGDLSAARLPTAELTHNAAPSFGRSPPPSAPAHPTPAHLPAPPPTPTPFTFRLRFIDLVFSDGAVSFAVGPERVVLACDSAREVHNDLRDVLDEELPGGVTVVGAVHPGGTITCEARGLDRLADLFERALFKQFVRQSVAAREWLDAEELASRRPGGGGRREPSDLLGIDAFGFGPRADAFRRLFAHRDRSERVRMLPGRAMVIPLPPSDGGARWYAWETVKDDHATYLFRPPDTGALHRMLAWTQRPGASRRELLADRDLQAELGFVRRVMHRAAEGEQLGRWWARLCAAIGFRADR